MMALDYAAWAELFIPKRKSGVRLPLSYRRFAPAAEDSFRGRRITRRSHARCVDAGGRGAL